MKMPTAAAMEIHVAPPAEPASSSGTIITDIEERSPAATSSERKITATTTKA